jgi:DNA gyrase subunit A
MVLELKKGADPQMVMAYLFKHTNLQSYVKVNLTCLVPTDNPEVGAPQRLGLRDCIRHFLEFRFQVVTRRLDHELSELKKRIHVLDAFARVYDALDEIITMIRRSEGKADAKEKLIRRFEFDEDQAEAILELKLYKLAKLEILAIQKELAERQKEARRLENLLASDGKRWELIRRELGELREKYADKRRTRIGVPAEEVTVDETAFIAHEDSNVVLTRDGWVKRVGQLRDISTTRVREGDEVMCVLGGSTKELVVFFSSLGSAYVCRVLDVPATTGYGEPVQKLFKFDDGEQVVAAMSLDPRTLPGAVADTVLLAVTKTGLALRFALSPHSEVSTRNGRMFAKLQPGDTVLGVRLAPDSARVNVVSAEARGLSCAAHEVPILSGAGKGVQLIKLAGDDKVLGFSVGEPLRVETDKGDVLDVATLADMAGRGGKGREVLKRGRLMRYLPPTPTVPQLGAGKPTPPAPTGGGGPPDSGPLFGAGSL